MARIKLGRVNKLELHHISQREEAIATCDLSRLKTLSDATYKPIRSVTYIGSEQVERVNCDGMIGTTDSDNR